MNPEIATTNFAQLMEMVALVSPELRVRFSTSHPKDMTDAVLEVMAKYDNICNYIHLPVQSGSTEMLKRMNRGYSRAWYLERISAIRRIVPNCSISTDIICGFCDETEEEHADTLSLMREVGFDYAYMYKYSERPKTLAERRFEDNVTEEEKGRRLEEVIAIQQENSLIWNKKHVGTIQTVLVEGRSKKSEEQLSGRNDGNAMVVFPRGNHVKGEYVKVKIVDCTSATLIGELVD